MKIKLIPVLTLVFLLSAGYAAEAGTKAAKAGVQKYYADLNGDGSKKPIEVEEKTAPLQESIITVRNNKKSQPIDSISIPGKIKDLEFRELNFDQQERIIVAFEDRDNCPNIAIYQLNNNKLTKIFSAASEYGIETDFITASRIKVGKASLRDNSPNLIPSWDSWVWCKDKFIKE